MARYFKIMEIDEDTFTRTTGDFLDCNSVVAPVAGDVYVAVDRLEGGRSRSVMEYREGRV